MSKVIRLSESELKNLVEMVINEISEKSDMEIAKILRRNTTEDEVEIKEVLGNMIVKLNHPHFFDDVKKRNRIKDFLYQNGFRGAGLGEFVRRKRDDDGMGMMESKIRENLRNILL
jgi:hypothetical protein